MAEQKDDEKTQTQINAITVNKYKFNWNMVINNDGNLRITVEETTNKDKFQGEYTAPELEAMKWLKNDIESIKLFIHKSLFDPEPEMSYQIGFCNKNNKNNNQTDLKREYEKDDCLVIELQFKHKWIENKWKLYLDCVDEDDVFKLKAIIIDMKEEISEHKQKIKCLEEQINKNGVPKGTIVMWSGSIKHIPIGWKLCDGSHNTPNLTGKFILGSGNNDEYKIGDSGGTKLHNHGITVRNTTLNINQIPNHSHDHTLGKYHCYNGGNQYKIQYYTDQSSYDSAVTTTLTSTTKGGNQPHNHSAACTQTDHLPPYIILGFIIKTD
eukprot:112278_1